MGASVDVMAIHSQEIYIYKESLNEVNIQLGTHIFLPANYNSRQTVLRPMVNAYQNLGSTAEGIWGVGSLEEMTEEVMSELTP